MGVLISGGKFNGGSTHRGFTVEYSAVEVKGQKKRAPIHWFDPFRSCFSLCALDTRARARTEKEKKETKNTSKPTKLSSSLVPVTLHCATFMQGIAVRHGRVCYRLGA